MRVHKPDKPSFKYYAKIARAIERQLFDEMNKPAKDRDQALIAECLETLDTIHALARALEEQSEHSKSRIHTRGWRRAAVIATIVIAALLSLAGIAEAVGIRIISLIKWDKNGLNISFGPNIREGAPPALDGSVSNEPDPYVPPQPQEEDTGGTKFLQRFDSFEEGCEAIYGFQPPMPAYLPAGARLHRISGFTKRLMLKYIADAGTVDLDFDYLGDSDNYVIGITYPDAIDYKSIEREGVKYEITIKPEDGIAVDWISDSFSFHIYTKGYSLDEVLKIIYSFNGGNN